MKGASRVSHGRRRPGVRRPAAVRPPVRRGIGTACLAAAALLAAAGPLRGQDKVPRIPSGVPLVLTPVQAILPTASGAFPGGAKTRSAALEAVDAEVDFAVSEEPRANKWASPSRVVRAAGRNPMLDVDPRQLSSRGLTVDDGGRYLYEPLHGQLRSLAALLDARMVALPLVVWYRPPEEREDGGDPSGDGEPAPPAGEAGAPRPDGGAAAEGEAAPPAQGARQGRAMMRLVLIDARAGRVLWKGEIGGAPAPPDSPAALATLAAQLVKVLSNS